MNKKNSTRIQTQTETKTRIEIEIKSEALAALLVVFLLFLYHYLSPSLSFPPAISPNSHSILVDRVDI